MSTPIDVPDGMQVTSTMDDNGEPCVEFYTGRWTNRYNAKEVDELITALQAWRERTKVKDVGGR